VKINIIIIGIFLISILILNGCTTEESHVSEEGIITEESQLGVQNEEKTEIVCNAPHIRYADDCCLDANSNNICDVDEEVNNDDNEIVEEVTDEEKLEIVGKKLGRLLELGDSAEIYDLLTPGRQSFKTKEEFVSLYDYITYGRRRVIDTDGDTIVFNRSYGNFLASVKFDELDISEDEGYVRYDITYNNGWDANSGTHYFKKVNNSWRFDGFSNIIYAGCFKDSDCYYGNNEILMQSCENTCQTETGMDLKEDEPLVCGDEVCQCYCYDETTKRGKKEYPNWKAIH